MTKEAPTYDLEAMIERAAREILENNDVIFDVSAFSQSVMGFTESIWTSPAVNREVDRKIIELGLKKEIKKKIMDRLDDQLQGEVRRLNRELLEHYNALVLLQLIDTSFDDFVDSIKEQKEKN